MAASTGLFTPRETLRQLREKKKHALGMQQQQQPRSCPGELLPPLCIPSVPSGGADRRTASQPFWVGWLVLLLGWFCLPETAQGRAQ